MEFPGLASARLDVESAGKFDDDCSMISYSTYTPLPCQSPQSPTLRDFPAPTYAGFFFPSYYESWERSDELQRPRSVLLRDGRRLSSASTLSIDTKTELLAQPQMLSNGLQDQTRYLPRKTLVVACIGLSLCIFLAFFEASILASALPTIASYFGAGRLSAWVVSAYLLTSAAFQPIIGRLSDIFGRKNTLLACLAVFILGSLASALARSIEVLIAFRAIAGAGGGGLINVVMILLSDIVSLPERPKYLAIFEIAILLALGSGPPAGGLFAGAGAETFRWCFWVVIPLGSLSMLAIVIFVPLKKVKGDIGAKLRQIDWVGAGLILAGTTGLLLAINWGGVWYDWVSAPVLGALLGGLLLFALLALWEYRVPKLPVIPHTVFKRTTCGGLLVVFFTSGAFFAQVFMLPQFLQIVQGRSPLQSGLFVMPIAIVDALSVMLAGLIVSRTKRYKPSIVCGCALWSIGLGLLSTMDERTGQAKYILYGMMAAAGHGQTPQTLLVGMQAAVPRHEVAQIVAMRSFMRELASTIALSVSGALLNNALRHRLAPLGFPSELIQQIVDHPTAMFNQASGHLPPLTDGQKADIVAGWKAGMRAIFMSFAVIVAVCAVATVLLVGSHDLVRPDDAARAQEGQEWKQRKMQNRRRS